MDDFYLFTPHIKQIIVFEYSIFKTMLLFISLFGARRKVFAKQIRHHFGQQGIAMQKLLNVTIECNSVVLMFVSTHKCP